MAEQDAAIPPMEEITEFANSDLGRQLITYFQKNDSPELQKAMQQASKGDYSQAKKIINKLLSAPGAPEISKRR